MDPTPKNEIICSIFGILSAEEYLKVHVHANAYPTVVMVTIAHHKPPPDPLQNDFGK